MEYFGTEEEAPEMDPALVEELERINKVRATLNHIEDARAKRVEIRQELEALVTTMKHMACQNQM